MNLLFRTLLGCSYLHGTACHIFTGSADVFPDVLHMSFTCKHVHSLLLHSKALHCLLAHVQCYALINAWTH